MQTLDSLAAQTVYSAAHNALDHRSEAYIVYFRQRCIAFTYVWPQLWRKRTNYTDDIGIYIKANGWGAFGVKLFMIRKIAMYALVKTGGKQYRVSKDDTILVERIAADEGAEVILNDIVMLADGDKVTIGTPKVEGAAVSATVMRQTRGPKIIIFRRKRRKNHRRTQGHRQDLTLLKDQ